MKEEVKIQKPSHPIPRKTKLLIKGLQSILPGSSYRLAKHLFFSPQKFPTPEREQEFKHSAILSREMVNNKRITVYHHGQSPRKILLTHGWSGRATQFFRLAPALQKAGFKVYTFTAPAHGTSNDKQSDMLEFADCICYLNKQHGPFEALIGHSIGGAATVNAIHQGVKTNKVVLLGSPGYIHQIVHTFCNTLGFNKRVEEKLLNEIRKRHGNDLEQYSITELAKKTTTPGLIIHDEKDIDVDVSQARENHAAWKNSKYIETSGLGHQRILTDPDVIKQILDFLV